MEKKDKKQRDIVLSQDNALTTARYKFDLIEKRALYSIIRNIRAQYIVDVMHLGIVSAFL